MGSKLEQHNMEGQRITTEHLSGEVFVAWNGPEIQHCDNVLWGALNRYFGGKKWHFITFRVVKVHTIHKQLTQFREWLQSFQWWETTCSVQ